MIKLAVTGIWACLMLSGSFLFFNDAEDASVQEAGDIGGYFGTLESVALGSVNVVVIRENEVRGYLIMEPVAVVNKAEAASLSLPIEYIVTDRIIGAVHQNSDIDIFRLDRFDLKGFQDDITLAINTELGRELVHEILIQRIDFITRDEIRDMQLRRS